MPPTVRHPATNLTRLAAILVVVLAYLLVTVGFPLPARSAPPTASFRCAGRACGCSSAEQCRRTCCCSPHTAPPGGEAGGAPFHWVVGVERQKCRGLATTWITGAVALPPPPPCLPVEPGVGTWELAADLRPSVRSLSPALPPPRSPRTPSCVVC